MGTRMLSVALGPKLVALITSPANSPPNGTRSAGSPGSRTIRVLPMFWLWPCAGEMRVVDTDMLLELLKSVVGARG